MQKPTVFRSVLSNTTRIALFNALHSAAVRPTSYQGGVAAAWFDSKRRLLDTQRVHEGMFARREASEGLCLAALVKRGVEIGAPLVVLALYSNESGRDDFCDVHHRLARPLASVGIALLDLLIVNEGVGIGSKFGKVAPLLIQ